MRKRVGLIAVLFSVVLYSPTSARLFRQESSAHEVPTAFAEGGQLWFVELSGAPVADGGRLTQVRNEKAAFRRAAAEAGVKFEERLAFDTLWNGLSVSINRGELGKLSRIAGVKRIYPVATIAMPQTQPAESPELFSAIAMTGADIAQNELGLNGQGVKVAVMDTGVDYHHPDLGGSFGPGARVVTGWDFVGDDFNADPMSPTFNLTTVPDGDPDDCNGHGTHVAGIIGANGGVKGVAPGVTFGAYRVFGCEGSTAADIMIEAMERALADGMDVLNMSIGSSFQWPEYPTAQAADRLVNKGMVVVASAGNRGTNGLFSLDAPSVGQKVISVASFDNTRELLPFFTASPDDLRAGYNSATAAPPAPTSGTFVLAKTGTVTTTADACGTSLPAGSLTGKIALIRRGTCSFFEKARNAQNAGAVGVVLYNNTVGRINPTVAGDLPITIPVVAITAADGAVLDSRIEAGGATMTWTADRAFFPSVLGNLISSFSSYGLSPDLTLKPDLGAPGGSIFSTFPLERGGFASLSGTSMASAHVAGAVALLLQAHPNTPAQAVRGILQNSADPKVWSGNPALGLLDSPHRQGAGMLDIDDAIISMTKVEPSKLSLGESEAGPATRTLTVTNNSAADVTYALSHVAAVSTNLNTFAPGAFTTAASVMFTDAAGAPITSLTVPAGGTVLVNATIAVSAPAVPADRRLYGGYLTLTAQGSGAVSRIPYGGVRGDYQSISVLDPAATAFGFPWLAQLGGGSFSTRPNGATYTMSGDDIPFFLVHLDHHSRRLRLDVTEVATGRSWFRALDLDYVGRNANRAGTSFFFALPWDGTTQAGKRVYTVPNGHYQVTLSVLKALGDESNPAHVESWTSPVVTVARPASITSGSDSAADRRSPEVAQHGNVEVPR